MTNGVSDGYSFTESAYRSTTGYLRTGDWPDAPGHDNQWRMPGTYDFENLFACCDAYAYSFDGVMGYKFVHKSNGNSIFIPDAGYYGGSSVHYLQPMYWTSEYKSTSNATEFSLRTQKYYEESRYFGLPVRPVAKMGDVAVEGVSIDNSLVLDPGEKGQLTATVSPYNATNKHVTWSSSNTSVATVSSDGLVTAVSGGTARITATTVDGLKTASIMISVKKPFQPLSGVFSVSATKKVKFSPGNLQATYYDSEYTFGVAKNQYDYIGNAPGNTTIGSQTNGAVVDLFGWSTASTNYGISTSTKNSDYSGDFIDWGTAIDKNGTWRTLTEDEQEYLFRKRTNASKLYKLEVSVCGKPNCLIVAPDGYSGTIKSSYDAASWAIAEADGLVCLPPAGYRSGNNWSNSWPGCYWTSTSYNTTSAYYYRTDNTISDSVFTPMGKPAGLSVRLVTDVK